MLARGSVRAPDVALRSLRPRGDTTLHDVCARSPHPGRRGRSAWYVRDVEHGPHAGWWVGPHRAASGLALLHPFAPRSSTPPAAWPAAGTDARGRGVPARAALGTQRLVGRVTGRGGNGHSPDIIGRSGQGVQYPPCPRLSLFGRSAHLGGSRGGRRPLPKERRQAPLMLLILPSQPPVLTGRTLDLWR
jgi:hypothetical protein